MVIVRLKGGLGNQLFQYATGRAIARRRRVRLNIDLSGLDHGTHRTYELENFNTSGAVVSVEALEAFKGFAANRVGRFLDDHRPYYRKAFVRESNFTFDPNILQASRRVYLEGFWQSENYFKDIESLLRRELTVRSELTGQNLAMAERIEQSSDSVSLHIRRGDYVSDPVQSEFHGTCALEYYQSAVAKLIGLGIQPTLFVFSDDIPWAEANLHFEQPMTFINHNGAEAAYEDLRLMSLCRHQIIANSSFSWWGAWLNPCSKKVVIAPRRWFKAADMDTRDLIPDNWFQI
jgi:hypothetical protein